MIDLAFFIHYQVTLNYCKKFYGIILLDPTICKFKTITIRSTKRFVAKFSNQLDLFQPVKIGVYIQLPHSLLLLFRRSFTLWQIHILQCSAKLIILCQRENIIIKLQSIQYSQIDANCHCWRSLLDTRNRERRTSCSFSPTCATLKLRRRRASFICSPTTCIFCSSFRGNLVPIVLFAITVTYHIICKDNTFSLLYDMLNKNIVFTLHLTSKTDDCRSPLIAHSSFNGYGLRVIGRPDGTPKPYTLHPTH